MDDVGGVHEEEAAEDLVDEVLDVVVAEFLAGVDDAMKVCLHEIGDDVNVGVSGPGFGLEDVYEPYDIIVLKELCVASEILRSLISLTILLASMRS